MLFIYFLMLRNSEKKKVKWLMSRLFYMDFFFLLPLISILRRADFAVVPTSKEYDVIVCSVVLSKQ